MIGWSGSAGPGIASYRWSRGVGFALEPSRTNRLGCEGDAVADLVAVEELVLDGLEQPLNRPVVVQEPERADLIGNGVGEAPDASSAQVGFRIQPAWRRMGENAGGGTAGTDQISRVDLGLAVHCAVELQIPCNAVSSAKKSPCRSRFRHSTPCGAACAPTASPPTSLLRRNDTTTNLTSALPPQLHLRFRAQEPPQHPARCSLN